jgi:hypothetical protein
MRERLETLHRHARREGEESLEAALQTWRFCIDMFITLLFFFTFPGIKK